MSTLGCMEINEDFYREMKETLNEISNESEEDRIRKECYATLRFMDKEDIYQWCASNEVEVYRLKKENEKLKETLEKYEPYFKGIDFMEKINNGWEEMGKYSNEKQ